MSTDEEYRELTNLMNETKSEWLADISGQWLDTCSV